MKRNCVSLKEKKDANDKTMQAIKSCISFKKGGVNPFFHKSQKSERTKDHEIAIHDGDLKCWEID